MRNVGSAMNGKAALRNQMAYPCSYSLGIYGHEWRRFHLPTALVVLDNGDCRLGRCYQRSTEDWDMLDVDEDEKLTGEEEFELLAGPLGLNERRIVPEPVQFPDNDPLGASVAMVTATNSMEETLMQI
eukprot:g44435.t1